MNGKNSGAYPTIDREALYPGLVQGVVPLQEREGGTTAIQAGNRPAMVLAGVIALLVVLRLLWEGAR